MCSFSETAPTGGAYNPKIETNIVGNIINNQKYIYSVNLRLSEEEGLNENTDNVVFYGITIEYTLDKVSQ